MAYDLALHSGSSGAPLFRFDAPDNTFCGVHIGGNTHISNFPTISYCLICFEQVNIIKINTGLEDGTTVDTLF